MNKLKTLSGAQLKYIAFTTMLIDHVNKALIYPNLNGGILLVISDIFDIIRKNSFPDLYIFIDRRLFQNDKQVEIFRYASFVWNNLRNSI